MDRTPGSTGERIQEHSFTRELGLTHGEFYGSLPPAIAHRPYTVEDHRIRIEEDDRSVTIELGPQRYRTIASLQLPYLEVRFTFAGFTAQERGQFMTRFERCFQRGGG